MLHIAWKTYTRYDVYGNVIASLLRGKKLYAWHNVYRKKWNSKVRNYNLRGLENEMNLKVLNFIEINKRSGWQVAPLRRLISAQKVLF